jgi:hypothetical protein
MDTLAPNLDRRIGWEQRAFNVISGRIIEKCLNIGQSWDTEFHTDANGQVAILSVWDELSGTFISVSTHDIYTFSPEKFNIHTNNLLFKQELSDGISYFGGYDDQELIYK